MPLFVSFLPKTQLHNGVKYFLKAHSYLMNLHFHEVFIKESQWKVNKYIRKGKKYKSTEKKGQKFIKIGRPIFALLPTHWSDFVTFCLTPRYRPRFFDQVGQETMYASCGNKHIFTKSCHRQTYRNYEQPPQTYQNSYFQSHFSVLRIGRIFPKKVFFEEYLSRRPTFIKKCFWKFRFLRYFIS